MLAKAGLSVEAMDSPSHLVNTFRMRINAQYFASVEGLYWHSKFVHGDGWCSVDDTICKLLFSLLH